MMERVKSRFYSLQLDQVDMDIRYECEGAAATAEHLDQLLNTSVPEKAVTGSSS